MRSSLVVGAIVRCGEAGRYGDDWHLPVGVRALRRPRSVLPVSDRQRLQPTVLLNRTGCGNFEIRRDSCREIVGGHAPNQQ